MVTADNLNLDCLELIFAHLYGNDLVSVSLVSRSFLAGVIPRLYRTLVFKLNQAKRYPAILSPFAAVLAHQNLTSHVRHIDIRTVPIVKATPNPVFLHECARTIAICPNLMTFICTPNVLPSFLFDLQDKESLQHLRVNASLTEDQAQKLVNLRSLKSIILDTGTPYIANLLPRWTTSLSSTLLSLTLYGMHDLNEHVLDGALSNLPNLKALHVIQCTKIDHHSVLSRTSNVPLLESLSFTTWESPRNLPSSIQPLRYLRHLAIDTHSSLSSNATPSLWSSIISLTRSWSPPLSSITFKLSEKLLVGDSFIHEVLTAHAATLRHFAILNGSLSLEAVRTICSRCSLLERFAFSIPSKDIFSLAVALSRSKTLHTLSDVSNPHLTHGHKVHVSPSKVRTIVENVPSLQKVITDGRIWTVQRKPFQVYQERKRTPPVHWFMPPSGSNFS
ncbi:hypothetical protein IEO21_08180 [Rhodonia placenta]|uniref:F-box domain-containing protein n=1 Tax=Rhodonia placenta TaxID=104341 RepID=A0A8H7NWS7_9APHY|nr:hypothetical protein IEO21_08180 [Postia placenta]